MNKRDVLAKWIISYGSKGHVHFHPVVESRLVHRSRVELLTCACLNGDIISVYWQTNLREHGPFAGVEASRWPRSPLVLLIE